VKRRARCLVAHPVNPPHLVPLVELSPAPWTTAEVVERACALLESVGQVPIVVRKEIQGFVLNRLQGALLAEAFRLYADGYASADDIDRTVRDGLGLRWSFMGPFETIDLNAPGGIADYCARFGELYYEIAKTQTPRRWEEALVRRIESERRELLDATELEVRSAWRDRRLMQLVAHKRNMTKRD
jgi:3-hydroxyacyl-CoA dehydrogenase